MLNAKKSGKKKQTKFQYTDNDYHLKFVPKSDSSSMLIQHFMEGIISAFTKILQDLLASFDGDNDRTFYLVRSSKSFLTENHF